MNIHSGCSCERSIAENPLNRDFIMPPLLGLGGIATSGSYRAGWACGSSSLCARPTRRVAAVSVAYAKPRSDWHVYRTPYRFSSARIE